MLIKANLPEYNLRRNKEVAAKYELPECDVAILAKYLGPIKMFGSYIWLDKHLKRLEHLIDKHE